MDTTSPIAVQLLKTLDDLHDLAIRLFHSLSPPSARPPPPPPPPPIDAFLECDAKIADALRVARVHQIRQHRIIELENQVLALEKQLTSLFTELEHGRLDLEDILDEAEERVKAIHTARETVPYTELLGYAQKLAQFTSAPPNMPHPTQPSLAYIRPPFPNEETMRRGRLNQEIPLGAATGADARPAAKAATTASPKIAQSMHFSHSMFGPRHHDNQDFAFDLDLNPDL